MDIINASLLPKNHPKDYDALSELGADLDPLKLFSYLRTFNTPEIIERIQLDEGSIRRENLRMEELIRRIDADYAPLKDAMDFFLSDDPRFQDGQYFIPARKFIIPADSSEMADWVVPESLEKDRVDEVRFRISDNVLYKNLLTVMNILGNHNWNRPVYYSTTVSSDNYLNLDDYFIRENLVLRVAPVKQSNQEFLGSVDTDLMYKKLMEEFEWGGVDDPRIFMDENNLRMTIHYRYAFSILAGSLAQEGKIDLAREVLDECMSKMPRELIPYNAGIIPVIQGYFSINEKETALGMVETYAEQLETELNYYNAISRANPYRYAKTNADFLQDIRELSNLRGICMGYGEMEMASTLEEKVALFAQDYERLFR
jgi:hypothetical protein